MQTFLPMRNFDDSAKVLDWRRLGKQRVEVLQIYNALHGESKGWRNHPAVKMWEGYELALLTYGVIICKEWRNRGYKDTLLDRFEAEIVRLENLGAKHKMPPWIGDEKFHLSHRSNLSRKDHGHYDPFWPGTPANLEYVWPTKGDSDE